MFVGKPLSRFPAAKPVEDQPEQPGGDLKPKSSSWNPRKSVKSNAPRNLDSQPENKSLGSKPENKNPEARNGTKAEVKNVPTPKAEIHNGSSKKPEPKSLESSEIKKPEPKPNIFVKPEVKKSAEVPETRNDKPSTIEDLQSAIRQEEFYKIQTKIQILSKKRNALLDPFPTTVTPF